MDFATASDKVYHSLLVHKLHHYGIRGKVNQWIQSWLTDRKVTGRFGPIPIRTPGRFGPIPFRSGHFGLGRFDPILEVGRFGPILVGRYGPLYFI